MFASLVESRRSYGSTLHTQNDKADHSAVISEMCRALNARNGMIFERNRKDQDGDQASICGSSHGFWLKPHLEAYLASHRFDYSKLNRAIQVPIPERHNISALGVMVDTEEDVQSWLIAEFDGHPKFSESSFETIGRFGKIAGELIRQRAEIRRQRLDYQTATALLRNIECGIIVLGPDRAVTFTNDVADEVLADGARLQLTHGCVRPVDYHSAVRFRTAIDCMFDRRGDSEAGTPHAVMMMIPGGDNERSLLAVISPVARTAEFEEDPDAARAVIYLVYPEQISLRGIEPICLLHGLTPVETRLTQLLFSGRSVTQAAAIMHVTPHTARAYLKQIFDKTQTHRQIDLLRLLARYQRAVTHQCDIDVA